MPSLLAWYPDPDARARLRAALEAEGSLLVLAAGVLALAFGATAATEPQDRDLCARLLAHPDDRVSLAAAVAASLLSADVPEAALAPHRSRSGVKYAE